MAEILFEKRTLARERDALASLAEELQAGADRTPNSPEEQKAMIQQLRLAKKELTQAKRSVNEEMRLIRTEARQKGAAVGSSITSLIPGTGKFRRLERMSIRLQKESALAPHESSKAALERQLLAIERMLLWVQRFH